MAEKKDNNELAYRFKVNMFSHGIKSNTIQKQIEGDISKGVRRQIGITNSSTPPLSKAVKSALKK